MGKYDKWQAVFKLRADILKEYAKKYPNKNMKERQALVDNDSRYKAARKEFDDARKVKKAKESKK